MKTYLSVVAILTSQALYAASLPESQKIDQLLAQDWAKNNLKPNAPAPDDVLVRRLYLDIAGRIPTVEETSSFLESRDPDKRQKLIDTLLASDGYTSHTFNFFADLLRLTDNNKARVTAEAYEEWLKQKLKANVPYDQLVRDLLTTDGAVWDSGAIGFYLRDENKLDHLAYTSQVMLGTQIVCAQCHNHPFDKWTQMDYYKMAAFTEGMDTRVKGGVLDKASGKKALDLPKPDLTGKTPEEAKKLRKQYQVQLNAMRKEREDTQPKVDRKDLQEIKQAMGDVMKPLRYTQIGWRDDQFPKLPHDYKYDDGKPGEKVLPQVMFGHDAAAAPGQTLIQAFASWMTSPENPRFTTVIANRMWKRAFGQGLIEPVDEITDSTVPSNPALMDYLTQLMVDKKYSLKSFLRVIYNTDAYQRMASATESAPGEASHFTGPALRRMSAEQIWDSVATLVSGNIDSTVDTENERLHQYLDDLHFLTTTIKEKGAEGLVEISKKANASNEGNLKKLEEMRAELAKSDNPADVDKAKEIAREAGRLRQQKTRDILVTIMGEDRANDLRRGYNDKKDANKRKALSREVMAKIAALPKDQRKEAMRDLASGGKSSTNLHVRASEQSSPAKPGTFLRTFGQSDREEIDNYNRDASVPQALSLLNGPLIESITSPASDLNAKLEKEPTSMGRASLLYTALLSRSPTAEETKILQSVIRERGDNALEDISHALLTGSQFLFIQ